MNVVYYVTGKVYGRVNVYLVEWVGHAKDEDDAKAKAKTEAKSKYADFSDYEAVQVLKL